MVRLKYCTEYQPKWSDQWAYCKRLGSYHRTISQLATGLTSELHFDESCVTKRRAIAGMKRATRTALSYARATAIALGSTYIILCSVQQRGLAGTKSCTYNCEEYEHKFIAVKALACLHSIWGDLGESVRVSPYCCTSPYCHYAIAMAALAPLPRGMLMLSLLRRHTSNISNTPAIILRLLLGELKKQ